MTDENRVVSFKNIRYYMGRHAIEIIENKGNRKYIMHLEDGYVGNEKIGYKDVSYGDFDIVPTKLCRRYKA